MRLIGVAVLLVGGCAQMWAGPPPRPPTMADVTARCRAEQVLDAAGKPLYFMLRSACPLLAGIDPFAVETEAVRRAAPIGVLLERELMLIAADKDTASGWRNVVVYFAASEQDSMVEATKADARVHRVAARPFILDSEYAGLRARATVLKEDRAYDACHGFLMDVTAAAQDQPRSEACARLMAVIDRSRSMRQIQTNQEQTVSLERERLSAESRQAAALEGANAQRAAENLGRALERFGSLPPIQIPQFGSRTTTSCHTYGTITNCTTN